MYREQPFNSDGKNQPTEIDRLRSWPAQFLRKTNARRRQTLKKTDSDNNRADSIIAEARRNQLQRERSYREQALKLFPHICGRCGREFSGKQVRELTVHHRDHNHDNNPRDGSNWELLCLYCHDNEHSRLEVAEAYDHSAPSETSESSSSGFKAFAGLDALLKQKNNK